MVGASSFPRWLEILLGENFFAPCVVHGSAKKNERNIFCLDCCIAICPHCLPPHHTHHHYLQIRRYVYHDVIRLGDAQKLMDCSHVQPYTTNRAKVVFLTERSISRPFRGSGNLCIKCHRSLQHSYLFCSLSCKVHYLVTTEIGSKKNNVDKAELLPLFQEIARSKSTEFEDGQMTTDSASASASASNGGGVGGGSSSTSAVTVSNPSSTTLAITGFAKKKCTVLLPRVSCRPNCSAAWAVAEKSGSMSRRKGMPHRSPLY